MRKAVLALAIVFGMALAFGTSAWATTKTVNYDITFVDPGYPSCIVTITRTGDTPFDGSSTTTYTIDVNNNTLGSTPGNSGYYSVMLADGFQLNISWSAGSNVTLMSNTFRPGNDKSISYSVVTNSDDYYYVTNLQMRGMEGVWSNTNYDYQWHFGQNETTQYSFGGFTVTGEQNANIYILQDGKEYAIVSAEAKGEVPVNFKAKENGEYTLTVSSTLYSQLSTLSSLHLIDNLAGADIDLLQTPSYTFTARNDDYASRFKLVFNVQQGGEVAEEDFAFISNGELIVNGTGTLQVIDALGRELVCKNLSPLTSHLSLLTFKPGVYVLRLIDGENVKTQKIVIR